MRRRGQGLVEFALALPLVLFLMMAIADLGCILLIYAELAGGCGRLFGMRWSRLPGLR